MDKLITMDEVDRCGACRCAIGPGKIKFCKRCGVALCPICVTLPGQGVPRPLCWGCHMKDLFKKDDDHGDSRGPS